MDTSLPEGWKKEYDPSSQRHFYVDTKATPPRSIWVHPYDDEQYLKEHPEKRNSLKPPPPYEEDSRRHSWNGNSSSSQAAPGGSKTDRDRGVFGKFKDKVIGTKEEREAKRKQEEKLAAERRRQRQQLMAERNRLEQEYLAERMRSQRAMYNSFPPRGRQSMYAAPGPFMQQPYGSMYPQQRRRGFGGGGIGLPLVGGLAGGLLLGEMFDNDHGDYGGGDYGGGDYGGGGFDGGGGDFGGGSDF